jgi:hypothetical protein
LSVDLHHLERMQVLTPPSPLNFLRRRRYKEWWYTGVYDPATRVYVSWYFIRAVVVDRLTVTVFDPSLGEDAALPRLTTRCRLRELDPIPGLCLEGRGPGLSASFRWSAPPESCWRFILGSRSLEADVRIEPTTPAFTKFDDELRSHHSIVHYFHGRGNGEVRVPGGPGYRLTNAQVYLDHCYGEVPAACGWHWIAVQDQRVGLAVLVNYGPYGQRFAQVWLAPGTGSPRDGRWVRLEQAASFERTTRDDLRGPWMVTSADLEIEVRPRRMVTDRIKMPPLIGLLVDVTHTESVVEARGRVRVDGTWVDVGVLHGVMEQHSGHW